MGISIDHDETFRENRDGVYSQLRGHTSDLLAVFITFYVYLKKKSGS